MKEIVYISTHLPKDNSKGLLYGKGVFKELDSISEVEIKQIEKHNKNVWCRDYMPVKSSTGKYVQFKYAPSYMMESKEWKKRMPIAEEIHKELSLDCISSEIILDGGAIEVCGRKAIISDRVFRDNPEKDEEDILNEIKRILELDQLIVIPQYPYDFTGHVDGLVRFIDTDRVVINSIEQELEANKKVKNRYRKKLIENWCYSFKYALINAGLELECLPTSIPEESPDKSAEGIYINFLLLDSMILMPTYGNATDKEAKKKLNKLYKIPVIEIPATELSKEGGMINCVTWTK